MKTYIVNVNEYGTKRWYLNGNLHRTDGPAIEYVSGSKEWYLNGNLHRTDGPAVELASGSKCWYLNGKRHREDGPAVEYSDVPYSEADWRNQLQKVKAPCVGKVVEVDGVKYKLVKI
jgi:hypothetical protein